MDKVDLRQKIYDVVEMGGPPAGMVQEIRISNAVDDIIDEQERIFDESYRMGIEDATYDPTETD